MKKALFTADRHVRTGAGTRIVPENDRRGAQK